MPQRPHPSQSTAMPAPKLDDWVRTYGRALRTYFQRRAPGFMEADDLVQEVFARMARQGDLAGIQSSEAYLFRTARNVLVDSLRRAEARGGGQSETFDDDRHGEADFDPERVLIGKETLDLLINALHDLPEPVRAAFVLYHFEEYRHAEIARKLGVAVSTVEKYMSRANAHLLRRLDLRKRP
ncbi:RNA polymerase sigma factor [Hyphomonas sp.]|uniref:RNA polymerase sigma factor n=1 Tax=Hyphomonas sp. TaxID=87 RepID=UPI00391C55A8